jgi:hypothetical protein
MIAIPDHFPVTLPLEVRRRTGYCRECRHNAELHFLPARKPWACSYCPCSGLDDAALEAYIEQWQAGRSVGARPGIPQVIAAAVLARDGLRCRYCGTAVHRRRSGGPRRLHLDHVVPWSKVREHRAENIVVSCRSCNLAKSAGPATDLLPVLQEVA